MPELILGSNSPRRAQLLTQMGFQFTKRIHPIDETIPASAALMDAAQYLAEQKNQVIPQHQDEVILTADTIVLHQDESLAKPENAAKAFEMIRKMAGQVHQVITGVCLRGTHTYSFSCVTEVRFRDLSKSEIEDYIDRWKPFDKAGAYGIQDWIGLVGIEWIKGSFYNVVGLPTHKVYQHLTKDFHVKASQYSQL